MDQRRLIGGLIVIIAILGFALAYMVGVQKSLTPASSVLTTVQPASPSQNAANITSEEKKVEVSEVPTSPEPEKKMEGNDWGNVWLKTYQIGAAHPNSYDPDTFIAIDEHFAKDKNNVYLVESVSSGSANKYQTAYNIKVISGADPQTFVNSPSFPYSKDDNHAYYYGDRISGADPGSFMSMAMLFAKDRDHVYFEGKKMSADAQTVLYLNGYYIKDYAHVFYKTEVIKKADVPTFTTANAREAYDKNYNYYDGKIKDKR